MCLLTERLRQELLTQMGDFRIKTMKKKTSSLQIPTPRDKDLLFFNSRNGSGKNLLLKVLTKSEVKKLEKTFNEFLELVSNNSNKQNRELLTKFKLTLRDSFLVDMYSRILTSPLRHLKNADDETIVIDIFNDKKLRNIFVDHIVDEMFYYSDIVFAFALGKKDKIDLILEKLGHIDDNISQRFNTTDKLIINKDEENKKFAENLCKYYIKACEEFETFKPTFTFLSEISEIKEGIWKREFTNIYFLGFLSKKLKKKFNLQNKKNIERQKFWWKAIDYIENKIDFVSDPDGFRKRIRMIQRFDEKNYNEESFAKSKGKRIQGQGYSNE